MTFKKKLFYASFLPPGSRSRSILDPDPYRADTDPGSRIRIRITTNADPHLSVSVSGQRAQFCTLVQCCKGISAMMHPQRDTAEATIN